MVMDQVTYEAVADRLQQQVNAGEITKEYADKVNDAAYDRYIAALESAIAEEQVEAEEDVALEKVMGEIAAYLTEAKCKIATGETVIGADKSSDTTVGSKGSVSKTPIEAHSSNVSADPGLGSKKLAGDINSLVDIGNSESEDIEQGVKALRLKVYEAFEAGIIDEEDKETMLESLDLSNYTLIEEQ